ncbi:hypothetical protein ZWY2020_044874 [Hordeum vulgare]|nr:hypothetical protein ZWY2020_044874 [Hordeum vulgare]
MRVGVCMVLLLFIGGLVALGQCRLVATRSNQEHGANITANATSEDSSLNESKLTLKWCVKNECGHSWFVIKICHCCVSLPGRPCWHSIGECQANCPTCHPYCPPASAMGLHA